MLLTVIVFIFSARADVTVSILHETQGKLVDTTLSFAGEQLRMDSSQGGVILTPSKDKMIMLMHAQKQYMQRSLSEVAAMNQAGAAISEAITFKNTEEQQVINGFECVQIIGTESGGDVTEFWVSKDSVHTDKFLKSMEAFTVIQKNPQGGNQMEAWQQFFEKNPEFSTFPIRTIAKNAAGVIESISTVKSISEDKIPASRFEVPAGYKELNMSYGGVGVTAEEKAKSSMPTQSHSEVLQELQALQKEIQNSGGQPTPAQIQRLQELAKQYKIPVP